MLSNALSQPANVYTSVFVGSLVGSSGATAASPYSTCLVTINVDSL